MIARLPGNSIEKTAKTAIAHLAITVKPRLEVGQTAILPSTIRILRVARWPMA